jgi:hypothetical protein
MRSGRTTLSELDPSRDPVVPIQVMPHSEGRALEAG